VGRVASPTVNQYYIAVLLLLLLLLLQKYWFKWDIAKYKSYKITIAYQYCSVSERLL